MHCDVVRDLIPSYLDEICSEKTKELVEEHLSECPKCQELVNSLKTEIPAEVMVEAKKPWLKVKRTMTIQLLLALVLTPLFLLGVYVGICTFAGEGLTLDALMHRRDADQFLHALSLWDYETASSYLSCDGKEDVSACQMQWAKAMTDQSIEFHSMKWAPLAAEDGIAQTRVVCTVGNGEKMEFVVMVQSGGLSVSSIYVYGDEGLTAILQETMTCHNPG